MTHPRRPTIADPGLPIMPICWTADLAPTMLGNAFGGPSCGYSSRMRRWLLLAVAFPFGAWLLARLADQLAARRGEDHLLSLIHI